MHIIHNLKHRPDVVRAVKTTKRAVYAKTALS